MPDNATASQDMGHPQKGLEFQRHIFALPEIPISEKTFCQILSWRPHEVLVFDGIDLWGLQIHCLTRELENFIKNFFEEGIWPRRWNVPPVIMTWSIWLQWICTKISKLRNPVAFDSEPFSDPWSYSCSWSIGDLLPWPDVHLIFGWAMGKARLRHHPMLFYFGWGSWQEW